MSLARLRQMKPHQEFIVRGSDGGDHEPLAQNLEAARAWQREHGGEILMRFVTDWTPEPVEAQRQPEPASRGSF